MNQQHIFRDFDKERLDFLNLIEGIEDDRLRRWYASVLLNRLMFIYFLQKKGFLDGGNQDYLHEKLTASKATSGEDTYFSVFLKGGILSQARMPDVRGKTGIPPRRSSVKIVVFPANCYPPVSDRLWNHCCRL